jgi:biotin carboxyl carrier protein
VFVNGQPVPVAISGRGQHRTRRRSGDVADKGGPQPVVAPMPGRIVKVLVKAGDTVAARQGLVVVEAMKMENELRSPKAGTVSDVRVTEGMLVEAKAVLVIVA